MNASENRFGMFIHWGIYALTGIQEQAFARMDMPREEYEGLKYKFNPVDYDPEKWVLAAKAAGMSYICFATKHHDGFCMWDSAYTDYKITETPYGRDVLKMLADACHKHGMLLSLYYSCPDWHHPLGYNPNSSHQWKAVRGDKVDTEGYRQYVKNQVTELLTNYGPIYRFFWDIPPKIDDPSLNVLVRRLQPGIFINDRGYDKGDFSTPEREYQTAEGTRFTRMTEANNSLGAQSWGYRKNEDFYTFRHLASSIDKIMAMGGSYVLNVGPDPRGNIPEEQLTRLARIGDWYRRTEGCLENAEGDDFDYHIRPKDPVIANKKNGRTYLHFYAGLCSSAVNIKYYPSLPRRVRLLNTGAELPFAVERMPEYHDGKTGVAQEYLHISHIPADDLAAEPIILEIEWSV